MDEQTKIATIRFDTDDYAKVKLAAKREGLDVSSFVRRCTMLYTREHHPELFDMS